MKAKLAPLLVCTIVITPDCVGSRVHQSVKLDVPVKWQGSTLNHTPERARRMEPGRRHTGSRNDTAPRKAASHEPEPQNVTGHAQHASPGDRMPVNVRADGNKTQCRAEEGLAVSSRGGCCAERRVLRPPVAA